MSSLPPEERVVPPALGQAWHTAKPSAGELQRGYSRYLRRRSPQRKTFGIARWVLGGLVLGAGLAQAASMTPWQRWFGQNQVFLPHAPAVPNKLGSAAMPVVEVAPAPLVEDASAAGSTPVAAPAIPPAPVAVPERAATPARSVAGSSAASFRVQEQWRLAAEGLRNGNFNQAHQALLELERTTGSGERDAARLARAQLLASHGRGAEALVLSRELEARASSSLVRTKARELSEHLAKNSAADRSAVELPGINQP
ncbi:MAG TPA: hypothetical protein VHP33_20570 [Polyangiaceae bacterium]|nr:hypothetical protein [Polyangiaceae bacterium]